MSDAATASATTFLNKLLIKPTTSEDKKCYIYMQSKWYENCIKIVLQDSRSGKCYKSTLKHEDIKQAANELEQNYDEFFIECRNALTSNVSLPGFEYEISTEEDSTTATTTLKLIKHDEFEVVYLELPLTEAPNNYELLDTAIELNAAKQTSLATEQEQQNVNSQNYEELLSQFRSHIAEKEQIDRMVYKKFILLLNSKKAKIAALMQRLEEEHGDQLNTRANAKDDDADPQPSTSKKSKKSKQRLESDGDNDDCTEVITNDNTNNNNSAASTVQVNNDDDDDEDFMAPTQALTPPALDGDDDELI